MILRILRGTSLSLLLPLSFATFAARAETSIRVVDGLGHETILSASPTRILPLMPSLAELIDALEVPPSSVVGVTEYTDFPVAYRDKPSIGPYAKPNLERIAALKPDLVLASRDGTPKEIVARLRKLGFPVVTVATESLSGLRESFPIVGSALGKEGVAKRRLAQFDEKLDALRIRAKGRAPRTIMLQVGEDPAVVAAGKTFLHEGLVILGLRNIYGDAKKTYPRVAIEDVLRRRPDLIILVGMGADREKFERARNRWGVYPQLRPKEGRPGTKIALLWSDALVRPGPRFPDGLSELEKTIFGEEP